MSIDPQALATLIAKEEIRDLVLLYSRGVDRKDGELLKTLYTKDGSDDHGAHYSGDAAGYVRFLEKSFPYLPYSGHHVCNHLISVDGDTGEGEVYAIAWHLIPDGKGGMVEDFMLVRYIDRYRREEGRWKFASRTVAFDHRTQRPLSTPATAVTPGEQDASYKVLASRLFARGPRG